MVNLAIIDADSIAYLGGKEDSLQQILEKVDYKIQEILDETKADYYVLLISKGKYFRHDISKSKDTPEGSYKSNRSYTAQQWVKTIKEYLIVKYKAVWYPKLEADDMAAWLMNKKEFDISNQPKLWGTINKILVAKDKDLLYSIPGKHLNFSKKLGPEEWGMEWIETSEEAASTFKATQLLMGDSSDGIEALKGIGPKKAEKILEFWTQDNIEGYILNRYIEYYKDSAKAIYEFQKNYRLLHMLTTDEDMLREVGYIPQLPEFQKVVKEEIITNNVNKIEF
jgi:hypothetical protein